MLPALPRNPTFHQLLVHSWVLPQALLLAKAGDLAPGSISFLGQSIFSMEIQGTGSLASSLHSSERAIPAPQLPTGFTGADWDFDHSHITVQLSPLPSPTSLSTSPCSAPCFCPLTSLLHANPRLRVYFPGTDQRLQLFLFNGVNFPSVHTES